MSLHDMLDFGELSDEVTELIPDYKMVLLQPENYSEKQSKNMQSSLGVILGLLNCAEIKEDFQKYLDSHEKELESLSESAMAVLNEYCELNIPETEDLMPYIPLKIHLMKWAVTLILYPIIGALICWIATIIL